MARCVPFLAAVVALAALSGCDPTEKKDFHCEGQWKSVTSACAQFHITEAEALVGQQVCENNDHKGTWRAHSCPATLGSQAIIPGYCQVEASEYSLSGTDMLVYFYQPVTAPVAEAACTDPQAKGTWHP